MTTLNELRPGKTAVITGIEGTDAVAMRLMELGLFEGERISMQGMALWVIRVNTASVAAEFPCEKVRLNAFTSSRKVDAHGDSPFPPATCVLNLPQSV
ncbi:MAG: FeoA family protein [Planctomycetaceae bacterium]